MAEPSNARRAKVAGHFYYDWDLSKYRWTADAMDGNADAKNAKKAAFPNEVGSFWGFVSRKQKQSRHKQIRSI